MLLTTFTVRFPAPAKEPDVVTAIESGERIKLSSLVAFTVNLPTEFISDSSTFEILLLSKILETRFAPTEMPLPMAIGAAIVNA